MIEATLWNLHAVVVVKEVGRPHVCAQRVLEDVGTSEGHGENDSPAGQCALQYQVCAPQICEIEVHKPVNEKGDGCNEARIVKNKLSKPASEKVFHWHQSQDSFPEDSNAQASDSPVEDGEVDDGLKGDARNHSEAAK